MFLHYSDCEKDYIPSIFQGCFDLFHLRGCSGHLKKDGIPESMEEPSTIFEHLFSSQAFGTWVQHLA